MLREVEALDFQGARVDIEAYEPIDPARSADLETTAATLPPQLFLEMGVDPRKSGSYTPLIGAGRFERFRRPFRLFDNRQGIALR